MVHEVPRLPRAILFVSITALLISGCASMGKDECLQADWQIIGYEDGARGYPGTRIGVHRKACAQYGVTPDMAAYEAGRHKGLQTWCTPRNGYRLGLKGNRYNGVCPQSLEGPFTEAMGRGRAVHGYEKQVKKARQELKEMRAGLKAMDADLQAMKAELISDETTPRRRLMLLGEIRKLEADRDLHISDIEDMEDQVADMQANLQKMKRRSPYR
jgi:hypothetical protein